jgi:predicted nucleic acid-binding Zn ribbon protein
LRVRSNEISEDSCRGALEVDGHRVSWDLHYRSTFRVTLSNKGWIGFSRSPHSDALFSGEIMLDGQRFAGEPLGFGVQGHNCGYRHRSFWTWTHAYFPRRGQPATTLEALVYEMPFGLVFRKAVLWHDGSPHVFRDLRESGSSRESAQWNFLCAAKGGIRLKASIDGRGPCSHRIPYVKTDCSGNFEVVNSSLASASLLLERPGAPSEKLETATGAVFEMVG